MSSVVLCDDARAALLAHLRTVFPDHGCCLISDDVVGRLHGRRIADLVMQVRERTRLLTFPAGEESKSREVWGLLTDAMIDARFGRDTVVIAIGGGVTGDLAGFVAATYMRGVPIVHVPTSLVAMVDAAIGGKTAIDVPGGKNLVGAFHPPSAVFVDPGFLRTLPARQLREGLVEALKHGAIVDDAYFDWILAHARTLTREGEAAEPTNAWRLVERSIEIKNGIVAADPLEQGHRAILNFGHTIGHAIEQASGYQVSHGQAVAHGMVAEARIGEALGITVRGTSTTIAGAIGALELPPIPLLDSRAFRGAIGTDKKNRAGAVRMTLLRRIGEVVRAGDGAWTHVVPLDAVMDAVTV